MNAIDKIKMWLKDKALRERIARTLPADISVDSWIESALMTIIKNERVQNCTPASLLGCILEAASLGLHFDGSFGQLYMESKWKKLDDGGWEEIAQLQIGYRGLITLAFRSDPSLVDVEAEVVFSRDKFEWEKGSKPFLSHNWDVCLPDRGKPQAVYTGLRYATGHYTFKVFPYEKLLKTRDSAMQHKGYFYRDGRWWLRKKDKTEHPVEEFKIYKMPWFSHEEAMVIKTAIRQSSRWWRLGGAFERAAQLVMEDDEGIGQSLDYQAASMINAGEERARVQQVETSQTASSERLEDLKKKAVEQARAHKEKKDAAGNREKA